MREIFRWIPCPPYIVRGAGLQIWKLILVNYNCHMWPDKDSYSNRPGSYLIAKSTLTPCAGLQPGWLGRTSSFGWTGPIDPGRPKLSRKGIGVNTPIAHPTSAPLVCVRGLKIGKATYASLSLKICAQCWSSYSTSRMGYNGCCVGGAILLQIDKKGLEYLN